MKVMLCLMTALFLLYIPSKARASHVYQAYGIGETSCGKWIEARAGRGQYAEDDRFGIVTWAQGYLTATGVYGPSMRKTDPEGIEAYLDQYCAAHPVNEIEDAVKSLIHALSQ